MHFPLIWIVCSSPSKLIIFLLKKENSCSSVVVHPIEMPLLMSPCYTQKLENQIWNSMVSFQNQQELSQQYSHTTSQMRKTLYSPWWQISYLSIAFACTLWSKQVSLFRMSPSYSEWPIRSKQFHLLAVATSTLSATVSDRSQSNSPTCQELPAIIQYQICIVEQKKNATKQIGRNSFFIPPKSLPIITSSTALPQPKSDRI